MALVKICGLSMPDALDAAIGTGASHVGLVSFALSPRHLTNDALRALASRVPERVKRVGVFVDPDDALLTALAPALDVFQVHRAAPARLAAIRARHPCEVWAAIAVRTAADVNTAREYGGAADRILYDAKTPDGALPGGMGVRFDWEVLRGVAHPLPWALSGGLDAGNVGEAVRVTGAPLVDVSSGVESAPGVKDVAKIAAFLQAARL